MAGEINNNAVDTIVNNYWQVQGKDTPGNCQQSIFMANRYNNRGNKDSSFDINNGLDPSFNSYEQQAWLSIPKGLRNTIAGPTGNSNEIILAHKYTDVYVDSQERPRGYPDSATMNQTEGGYLPQENGQIGIITWYSDTTARKYSSDEAKYRAQAGLVHESMHALDFSLQGQSNAQVGSQSSEFIDAYKKDLANMTPQQKSELHYFIQEGTDKKPTEAGLQETWAEVGAILTFGHGSTPPSHPYGFLDDKLRQAFPNTMKVEQQMLNKYNEQSIIFDQKVMKEGFEPQIAKYCK